MSSDFSDFVQIVTSAKSLSSELLREAILSRGAEFWIPGNWWEWKQLNWQEFCEFTVMAVRSLDGSESEDVAMALIENLHITIPWCNENSAELCLLMYEEFVAKKVSRVKSLLTYLDNQFGEHPDFSERKQLLFDDLSKYRKAIGKLGFESVSGNWLDEFLSRESM